MPKTILNLATSPIKKESIPPYFNLNKSVTLYNTLAVPYIVRS